MFYGSTTCSEPFVIPNHRFLPQRSQAVAVVVTHAGQTAAADAETAKAPSPQEETTQPIAREFIAEDALLEHWQA